MTASASPTFTATEPIPGYRMLERIGAGGYGEVWKAEAPGGIAKAVKIVYGYHDDQRATRELTALQRVKQVRHPFVLSLERIEVVDNHLVIVTELATSSLKSLFDRCRESGLPGIPRDQLLAHLQDAADALDYLWQEHSLQHLDVKPENLLLVGGRIKVGDFGLVKDLQDVNCSNISGLTPVYAAPELFDGRPSRHSDQYSLAMVYQEMLTGVLPYEGRTTAQLAAQHLHSRPQLDSLPAADRAAIGRGLSKDPQQRFPRCREMVDALRAASPLPGQRWPAAEATDVRPALAPAAMSKTQLVSWEAMQAVAAAAAASAGTASRPSEPAAAVRDLPPLAVDPAEIEYRPTMIIGLGGLAARAVQLLRRRLSDRFPDVQAISAVELLVFDTDPRTLAAVVGEGQPAALDEGSAILLPLRPPADYRGEPQRHMQWLSRRWIYNIPRSLQTQGIRPLGRLAFVDHCERIRERIRRAIKAACDREGLAASAQASRLPFREAAPRIFVVSSTSGGSGGGMALDVGYLIRQTLRELHLPEDGLCGILAHLSGRGPQARDLALANTYAFLQELHQYSAIQGYPGDSSCNLPAFTVDDGPFCQTYFRNLGEDLDEGDFLAAADKLAKYLYYNVATPAGTFFDKCRAAAADAGSGALPQGPDAAPASVPPADPARAGRTAVRSFGVCQLGLSYDDVPAAAAEELCQLLLARWRGAKPAEAVEESTSLSDPTSLLDSRLAIDQSAEGLRAEVLTRVQAEVSAGEVADELYSTATREMGADPESYLLTVLGELVTSQRRGAWDFSTRMPPSRWILDALDTLIRPQDGAAGRQVCLEAALDKRVDEMAVGHGAGLTDWILGLAVAPARRIVGAQQTTDYVMEYLRTLSQQAGESIQALRREHLAIETALSADKRGSCNWLRFRGLGRRRRLVADPRVHLYFGLRIRELTLNGVCRLSGALLSQMAALNDRLRNLAADLNCLAEESRRLSAPAAARRASRPPVGEVGPAPAPGDETPAAESIPALVAQAIGLRKAEMVAEMERALEDDFRAAVTLETANPRRRLACVLRRAVQGTIRRTLKKIGQQEIVSCDGPTAEERTFSLRTALKKAASQWPGCGGDRRLLLVAPEGLSSPQLAEQLGPDVSQPPTVVVDEDSDVLLCCEMERLPLARLAAAVLDGRFHNLEVSSRLHTRIDVQWLPL